MGAVEWIVALFLVGVAGWLLWRLRAKTQAEMVRREMHWMAKHDDKAQTLIDFSARVRAALPPGTRYEVRLADWGPDFTGFDGTLPRWRWSVVDADLALRDALGMSTEVGTEDAPFMLGNAFSSEEAIVAAVHWVERQQHPVVPGQPLVSGVALGEVTPWSATI